MFLWKDLLCGFSYKFISSVTQVPGEELYMQVYEMSYEYVFMIYTKKWKMYTKCVASKTDKKSCVNIPLLRFDENECVVSAFGLN